MTCGICDSISVAKIGNRIEVSDHLQLHERYLEELREIRIRWPLIHLIEVTLRNKIAGAIVERFGTGFFLYDSPPLGRSELRKLMLSRSLAHPQDLNGVISNLPMGFWLSLLTKRYESTLWGTALHQIFSSSIRASRTQIHEEFRRIWLLRNRIAHQELILHRADLPGFFSLAATLVRLEPEFGGTLFTLHPVE